MHGGMQAWVEPGWWYRVYGTGRPGYGRWV